MPRRSGAHTLIAPSASLALASSILIALAALAPNGAAAKRSETSSAAETTVAPAASVVPAEPTTGDAAQRAAERQARRAERAAALAEAQAQSQAAAARAEARQAAHAQKQAENAATREARKQQAASAPAAARAGADAAAGAKAGKQTHAEKQAEHEAVAEQRRRANEARSGHARESKKQREAREAREGREAGEAEEGGAGFEKALGGTGAGRQGIAAGGVSSSAGGAPTAQPASTSAVASVRSGRAVSSARARARAHKVSRGLTAGAGAGALGLAAGTSLGTGEPERGAPGGTRHAGGGGHRASSGKGESQIVRTVTQIVGVIPAALWLLIGLLGLAAAAFAIASRVSARRARRLDHQRRALLEDVGLLQAALLPELPERLGPVATTAAYRPASGPGAGGDFYDVFALPEGLLAVIVGDVSGHGREALPHTTLLRYTLRAYMEAGLAPREALRAAAPALERQLGGSFATVVLASWDPRARRLTYSCAGHPHPIVTGLDPSASIIAASAPPIGAGNATGSRQTVMAIPGASTACFYTDGVIEARVSEDLYGSGRLASALAALRAELGAPAASELLDRVAAETDRRPDDMAACLLEIAGEEEEPRILSEELLLDAREAGGRRARRFLEAAGVREPALGASLERARTLASEHGSALVKIDLDGERPRVSVLQDNIAPLRARALARTQEVAL